MLVKKIWALKQLGKRLGIPNEDFITDQNLQLALDFSSLLLIKGIHPIRIACACAALDILLPGWKSVAPKNILGIIAERDSKEARQWIKFCRERDNHQCAKCGSKQNLSVHHICGWAEFPELRIEESNGITLCAECHAQEHPKLGLTFFIKNQRTNSDAKSAKHSQS